MLTFAFNRNFLNVTSSNAPIATFYDSYIVKNALVQQC